MALFNITLKSITSFISDSLCNIFTKVIHQPLAEYTFACGKVPKMALRLRPTGVRLLYNGGRKVCQGDFVTPPFRIIKNQEPIIKKI
jgi:hypothetical protein